jgi:hypothetical protein
MVASLACITGFKLYKNHKAFVFMPFITSYLLGKAYVRIRQTQEVFDLVEGPVPYKKAQQQREEVLNWCLLREYGLSMRSLKQELTLCKPPADYIYSSLV